MTFEPYSIVVVPFPFTDNHQTKRRPALVLSNTEHQEATQHITLLMITSAKNSAWPSDHKIKQLSETGLRTECIVRQKVFTIDQQLVIKRIGKLSDTDKRAVKLQLKSHISI